MNILFISQGYENLGIEYLSAVLKTDKDFNIKLIVDPCLFGESGFINVGPLGHAFNLQKKVIKEIIDFEPHLTIFSVLSDNLTWAINLAEIIKKHTYSFVLMGGIHPTSAPESVLKHRCVDYICIGEGETSLLQFCKELKNEIAVNHILGIVKEGFLDKAEPVLEDINKLPFPDKDLYYDNYPFFNYGYITSTSRGCPHNCSYCANSVLSNIYTERYHRIRETNNVLAELKMAKEKYKPSFIHFTDESFNISSMRCEEFLNRYKKEIDLPFSTYLYPDSVNEKNAAILGQRGCFKVQIGIQNADADIRSNIYNRKSDNKKIISAIKSLRKNNIFVSCDNIIGTHNEKISDIVALGDIYRQAKPDTCETYMLRFYPNTKITKMYAAKKLIGKETLYRINNGLATGGLFNNHDKKLSIHKRAIVIYLRMIPLMPLWASDLIKMLKLHYIFAYLPLWAIIIINKIIKKPKYDIYTKRTFNRYKFFIRNKLF